MIYLIIVGVVLWYGIGVVGSAIAIGSMAKNLDKMFPMLPPHNVRRDKLFGYLMALWGVGNVLSALLFSLINTHSLSARWEWLR